MAASVEAAALACAARLGATAVTGMQSAAECAEAQQLAALVALVARYEPSWAIDSETAAPDETRAHLVRYVYGCGVVGRRSKWKRCSVVLGGASTGPDFEEPRRT